MHACHSKGGWQHCIASHHRNRLHEAPAGARHEHGMAPPLCNLPRAMSITPGGGHPHTGASQTLIAMAALAADVLEALAEASPRQLSQSCRELYAQAAEAALVPATAPDDIARLHALFDAALDGGVGGLVVDYVTEVRAAAAAAACCSWLRRCCSLTRPPGHPCRSARTAG